ncbi:heavy-metal-associated domain-containing protein [Hymenobacter chitinivorans]|uniref:Copper chaperone CopZ n=1 Tax=Hymenobacter chitinivorans DSM 11115 TaxID=1121954 RepID=A0A2M9BMZ8_9BACT|nr:heavy-metal-associated domain-containing protein [Hymenobacter chitinivorans]PJJ59306.1 copper chaperone CopZ [Hymenobacter chitinivorans DSM 11115]
MKTLRSFWLAAVLLLTAQFSFAQTTAAAKTKGPATEVFQIKTSAVCDMCKARLEKALAYEKGVQEAHLDVPSKVLTVSYRPDKTTPAALRTAVQRTGYDADEQAAEARAYDRLPDCCKKTNNVHQDAAH